MLFDLHRTIELLGATPAAIRALTGDISGPWIEARATPESWSAFDIVGHLIHGEETDWIPRLRIILEHGELQPFQPFDRFAQFEKSKGKTLDQLVQEFEGLRAANLETLTGLNLQPAQLELKGTHPELGTVTVQQLLATWVVHDLGHIAQIARAMASAYAAEVGPWRAYLRILQD